MNKRGEGTAFGWFLGLLSLLVIGVVYIIFNQALSSYVQPTFDGIRDAGTLTNATQKADIAYEEGRYMAMWNYLPFIIVVIIILWIIINAIRRNRDDMTQ